MNSSKFRRIVLLLLSILSLLIAFLWWLDHRVYEPLLALIAGVAGLVQSFFREEYDKSETLDKRNRRIMLDHVENFWVKGILEKSLYGAALLELGIKEEPDAVKTYPWGIKRDSIDETLPSGMSMLDIFKQIGSGRSLLILGGPGSGKTTMLLELTRLLIDRARQDQTEPIPVVFNLASWNTEHLLGEWLVAELNAFYEVPKKIAPDWVSGNHLFLLLDGLDEVKEEYRQKCVEAINHFRQEHGLTNIAVCSRGEEYARLKTHLSFGGAIEIQPLTHNQIMSYFNFLGPQLNGVKQVALEYTALEEIAQSPLFLSIMALAYRNTPSNEIWVSEDRGTQRIHLFNTYVSRMFKRPERARNTHFRQSDVIHWLSWLAKKMITHNQTPLLLERMQPGWLIGGGQLRTYQRAVGWIVGIGAGLIALFSTVFEYGIAGGLINAFLNGLLVGGIAWKIGGMSSHDLSKMFEGFARLGVHISTNDSTPWKIGGINSKDISKLFEGIASFGIKIDTIDAVAWNWRQAKKWLGFCLILGAGIGLFIGLLNGTALWLFNTHSIGFGASFRIGLMMGLGFGLMYGMIGMVISGLKVSHVDRVTRPGERLFFFFKNFILVGLSFGLVGLLSFRLLHSLKTWLISTYLPGASLGPWSYRMIDTMTGNLIIWLSLGVIFGLMFGGYNLFQHYVLRLVLARYNLLPWKLIPFLDHCVDLIFLRRVGGGYIFVHRLLMEHFAELDEETINRLV